MSVAAVACCSARFVECEPQKAGRSSLCSPNRRRSDACLMRSATTARAISPIISTAICLEEDCRIASFLRGAFLMGGTVAGPDKKSHLELKTTHQSLSGEETSLMLDLGLSPKQAPARQRISAVLC